MLSLGWNECEIAEVDCTDEQATSLGIVLNRSAELSRWDNEAVEAALRGIQEDDPVLSTCSIIWLRCSRSCRAWSRSLLRRRCRSVRSAGIAGNLQNNHARWHGREYVSSAVIYLKEQPSWR